MASTRRTDEELAALAAGGDELAMRQLLDQCRGCVAKRASKYDWPGADAEDAVQEALLKLAQLVRDGTYDPTRSKLQTYFDVVVTNLFNTLYARSRKRRAAETTYYVLGEDDEYHEVEPSEDDPSLRNVEFSQPLTRALEILDCQNRVILLEYWGTGYTQYELAEKYGMTRAAVAKRLERTEERLRQYFTDNGITLEDLLN